MASPQFEKFGELLSKLPEELIIEILEHALHLPGTVAKTQYAGGECEWPACPCREGIWKHIPGEKLTKDTLSPYLAAPEPTPRLAQMVFYTTNTFHLCGPQNDEVFIGLNFWLPPPGIRHWIRHLEVEVEIAYPRSGSFFDVGGPPFVLTPRRDWELLRRVQRGVYRFTGLRTLKLMFECLFITKHVSLPLLDAELGMLEPFRFKTQELTVEACTAHPMSLEDDVMSGDIVRDERLGRVLSKYMSATGKRQSIVEHRRFRPEKPL